MPISAFLRHLHSCTCPYTDMHMHIIKWMMLNKIKYCGIPYYPICNGKSICVRYFCYYFTKCLIGSNVLEGFVLTHNLGKALIMAGRAWHNLQWQKTAMRLLTFGERRKHKTEKLLLPLLFTLVLQPMWSCCLSQLYFCCYDKISWPKQLSEERGYFELTATCVRTVNTISSRQLGMAVSSIWGLISWSTSRKQGMLNGNGTIF